jgi:tight adherence protein C
MFLVIPALIALSIILLFAGLAMAPQPTVVQSRLQAYGTTRPRSLSEIEMAEPFSQRVVLPIIRAISRLLSRLMPQRNVEEIRHRLDMAGNPNNWTTADFYGVRGLVALVLGGILFLPAYLLKVPPLQLAVFGALGLVIGFILPNFWLSFKISRRQHEMERALPDALDLLTISVEAGLGFDAAMAKVAEKSINELSRAFARVNAEVRLGKLRREALRDMAQRAGVQDISNFIAAVIQADQLGVSLSKVLRVQSEQMRVRRRQRAEELANQAPIKMLFPLVFLIFPSIFIVLLGPAVIQIQKSNLLGP